MKNSARFSKRLFAFLIDLTAVVILAWLLWLFPFQFVIGNSIQDNYKKEVAEKAEDILYDYDGKKDLFGASGTNDGYFPKLDNSKKEGTITATEYGEYISYENTVYTKNYDTVDFLIDDLNIPYNKDADHKNQEYVNIDELYYYLFYAYQAELNFPHNSEYISYSALRDAGEISSDDEQKALENEFKNNLKTSYIEQLRILVQALKYYDSLNPDSDILNLPVYKTLSSEFQSLSKEKVKDLPATITEADQQKLVDAVESYKHYYDVVTSKDKLGYSTTESGEIINLNEEAYLNFYYSIVMMRFEALRPYYIQRYYFSRYSTIYALVAFVVIFSIYTAVLRGQTLGRLTVKVKLVGKDEEKKPNPLLALFHDVVIRILYILLVGFFSLPFALIIALGLTIADALMIKFNKQNKTIRDIITNTKVVETEF